MKKLIFALVIVVILQLVLNIEKSKAQWVQVSNGIPSTNHVIMSLSASGTNIYAGVAIANTSQGDGVYYSTNYGASWIPPNMTTGCYLEPWALLADGNRVYAATSYFIWLSTNYGNTWFLPNGGHNEAVTSLTKCGGYILTNYYSDVFRSGNYGLDWDLVQSGIDSNYMMGLASWNNTVFAATRHFSWNSGKIMMSTDYGNSWIQKYNITNDYFRYLFVNGTNICAMTNHEGFYLSTDFGSTWAQKKFINTDQISSVAMSNNYIFAGTINILYFSKDTAKTWKTINEGFNGYPDIKSLVIANNYVFLGTTFMSLWRRPLSEIIGIQNISSEIPASYSLFQNYPNPFNPRTVIKFQLPEVSEVLIKVYDIMGREVETLVNERLQAGTYETTLDGSKLTSGVYFYKLTTGNFIDTKRMVLIK